ncbi:MAG TPA: ATP-binding protein [Bacteroidia bacterium]|jgi:PAS domain S-box-containing protein|nr:ATP-binding protein [Bacteroidia bacterium]
MEEDKLRILLLEDSPGDAELIQRELKKAGFSFKALVVDSREGYLAGLLEFRPSLILSDHSLPRMNSYEALDLYKQQALDIPFLLVTGTVSEEFAVESIKAGVDDYVLKSNLSRLGSCIRSAMQKKDSAKKTRLAEERVARAQRIAKLGNWEWNLATNTFIWSDEMYSILGLDKTIVPSREAYLEAVHPEDRHMVRDGIEARFTKGSEYNIDYRVLRADGEMRYVSEQADIQSNEFGEIISLTGTLLDITERKKFEHQLDKERKFLQAVLESINVGVIASNGDGEVILFNDYFKNIHCLPAHEVPISTWDNHFKVLHSDGKTPEVKNNLPLTRALRGEKVANCSYMIVPTKGPLRKVSVNAQILKDQDGKSLGAVAAIHDETKLRNSEEKLRIKIQELDTFIYKASHDLKGPLSSMAGLINLAKIELTDSKSKQYIDRLEQSNKKLEAILEALYEIAYVTQGNVSNSEVNITEMVQDIINSLKDLPKCQGIRFEVECDADIPLVSDQRLLRGVLQNLIHNAIKYRRDIPGSYIRITATHSNGQFNLTVSDNGIGIEENLIGKIFDMFFRGHYTSTGSGLGLYIVKNAIEKLNGHISVESIYGASSSFRISCPLWPEPELSADEK